MAIPTWLLRLVCLAGALGVAAVAAYPWIDPRFGYFVDDGQLHAIRLYVFDHLLRHGAPLFPRWWQDLGMGFGGPLLNYYSPGTYYLGEAAILMGSSIYRSLQWVGVFAILAGAIGAFMLGDRLTRQPLAGLVASVAFVGAPYPLVTTLYQRSAIPEALGVASLPWALTAAWLAIRRRDTRGIAFTAVAIAATFFFHNLSALVLCGALVPWSLAAVLSLPAARRRPAAGRAVAGVALGAALAAVLWLPALAERGAVHSELGNLGNLSPVRSLYHPFRPGTPLLDMAVPLPYEVTDGSPIDLHWTYPHARHSLPGPAKPSLAQALLLLTTAATSVVGWASLRRHTIDAGCHRSSVSPRTLLTIAGTAGILVAALYFLQTVWSAGLWEVVPLLSTLQFPWRLLALLSLLLALGSAAVFAWLSARGQQQWMLALVLVAFVAANGLANRAQPDRLGAGPSRPPPWDEQLRGYGVNRLAAGTLTGGEFLPRSVVLSSPVDFARGGQPDYEGPFPKGGWVGGRVWPYRGTAHVQQVWAGADWAEALVEVPAGAPATLAFRTLVFPGMRAYVDGAPAAMTPAPFDPASAIGHGFALVSVPPGTHRVQVAFGSTFWRTFATVLTLAAAAVVAALMLPRIGPRVQLRQRSLPAVPAAILALAAVAGLFVTARSVVEVFRSPHRATAQTASLVARFTDSSQPVRFTSPAGSATGTFIDVRDVTIDGHTRRWLYMHPPAEAQLELDVPQRAVFQAGLALDEGAWSAAGADGVRFQLEVRDSGGATHVLLDEVLQPQARAADRGWRFAQADLGRFAGQRVTLTLRTSGRDTPQFDWAGWADPAVYVDRSALYPPPTEVAPARRRLP